MGRCFIIGHLDLVGGHMDDLAVSPDDDGVAELFVATQRIGDAASQRVVDWRSFLE